MSRHDLEFEVHYAIRYEQMMSLFFGRIDKLMTLVLLLSGASVVANLMPVTMSGVVVTLLSGLPFVYQFSGKSVSSSTQAVLYRVLRGRMDDLSDTEIRLKLQEISKTDHPEFGMLAHPAYLSACLMMGLDISGIRSMTWLEKVCAWISGDCPEMPRTISA